MSVLFEKGETHRTSDSLKVVMPHDAAYDELRQTWNLLTEHRPAMIVVAESSEDVRHAIFLAKEEGLPVAVQATGHGMPRPANGAMLIVTRAMNQVHIDPTAKRARVGGGAIWAEVLAAAQEYGLAGMSGSAPHVGVVGYTLGGGFSIMSRTYGLAIDHLVSAEIVTPNGDIVKASATENPDLFWAIRGGGGAFGVITEIEIDLVEQPFVYGGQLLFPIERSEEVLARYIEWTASNSTLVNSSFVMMAFPPLPMIPEPIRGKSFAIICLCVCDVEEQAKRLIQPMVDLGPIMDTTAYIPYDQTGVIYQDPIDPLPAHGQGVMLRNLTVKDGKRLVHAMGDMATSPNLRIEIRHLGGAIRQPAAGESTAVCREANYLIYLLGVPMMATTDQMNEQAVRVLESVQDQIACYGPLNFIGDGRVTRAKLESLYDSNTMDRMSKIKASHDAENRFRFAGLGIED